ncbi:DUF4283 domain-containing protein [Citrus sinensis]|uniref:DUF4283 domain-containing protein n=1 Tax=Citrus sinensis TaxID=2711 RepID=A0ACB8KB72_CITSI|nr:DUF4283 domain-containing protein [Citrus sinensis]
MEKNPNPPMADDRSTKKARFKAQGEDGDNPQPHSFGDKLMSTQRVDEGVFFDSGEDLKVHAQLMKPWQYTVVFKLWGRRIVYRTLCNSLETIWSSTQGFSVIDLENDYYLVRFRTERDVEFALTQGPWTILGHYLTVKPWTPHFDISAAVIEYVIAWIRLPGMALHYYNKKILRMLGQIFGRASKIDYSTESASRGKFAHLAVEIDPNKPLISQFLLDGKLQKVEYEGLPNISFLCGKYGHSKDICPNRTEEDHALGNQPHLDGANESVEMNSNWVNDLSFRGLESQVTCCFNWS